jgi:hypothetical protein
MSRLYTGSDGEAQRLDVGETTEGLADLGLSDRGQIVKIVGV